MAKRPTKTKAATQGNAGAAAAPVTSTEPTSEQATASQAEPGAPPPARSRGGVIVTVRSKRPQGRRRAGRAFGLEPVELDTSVLSPRELDGLISDPELIVDPPLE